MKVYRFLKWTHNNLNGSANELDNFKEHGLISPSYIYLSEPSQTKFVPANTLGKERCMSKYFFLSLLDALTVGMEVSFSNIIIELDIPDEIVRANIGVGFYGDFLIECCIPYQALYESLAKNPNESFFRAIEFYNRNFHVDMLRFQEGYEKIEALLLDAPYKEVHHEQRLSIYPLFCFLPNQVNSWFIQGISMASIKKRLKEILIERQEKYHFQEHLTSLVGARGMIRYFDPDYSKDDLFLYAQKTLTSENETLKLERLLK